MNVAPLDDQRVKTKESEKIGKYMDLARELNKQWNMGAMILVKDGDHGTVSKCQEKDWRYW